MKNLITLLSLSFATFFTTIGNSPVFAMSCNTKNNTEMVCNEDNVTCEKKIKEQRINWNMSKHLPEFYESIVEASNRGELWGIESPPSDSIQLEIDFNPSSVN